MNPASIADVILPLPDSPQGTILICRRDSEHQTLLVRATNYPSLGIYKTTQVNHVDINHRTSMVFMKVRMTPPEWMIIAHYT
jgi:hypothetical protein